MYSLNVSKKTPMWMNCLFNVKKKNVLFFFLIWKGQYWLFGVIIYHSSHFRQMPQHDQIEPMEIIKTRDLVCILIWNKQLVFWSFKLSCWNRKWYNLMLESFQEERYYGRNHSYIIIEKKWCIICPQIAHKEFKIHHTV